MFTKSLYGLKFVDEIANELFSQIQQRPYNSAVKMDNSFLATLRALVKPRIPDDETLTLFVGTFRANDVENLNRCIASSRPNAINYFYFFGDQANAAIKEIDDNIATQHPEYEELRDLSKFVEDCATMRFLINKNNKTSIVITTTNSLSIYHYTQSLISRLLPWYFDDNPLTDEERELVRSLTLKTSTKYEKTIEDFIQKFDSRGAKIRSLLKDFEINAIRDRLDEVNSQLQNIDIGIQNHINLYRDLIKRKEETNIIKIGLINQIGEKRNSKGESELMEYLLCNKHVDLLSASNGVINIVVKGHMDNYDPDMYKRFCKNPDSYIYTGYTTYNSDFTDQSSRKKLLDAIFSDDPIFRIKTCAYYILDIHGCADSSSYFDYSSYNNGYIPNPHIKRFSCLGNHKPLIEECLRDGDNVGAIEQCISSAKSINIGESVTFCYLLQDLFTDNGKKWLEASDGECYTPSEALKFLEDMELGQD